MYDSQQLARRRVERRLTGCRQRVRYLLSLSCRTAGPLVIAVLMTPTNVSATPGSPVRVTPLVAGLHSEIYVRYDGRGIGIGDDPGGDEVTLTGPADTSFACRNPLLRQSFEYELGQGTITLQIGPGARRYPPDTGPGTPRHVSIPILTRAWCPGRYHGEVDFDTGGSSPHLISYGTFTFRIARRAKRSANWPRHGTRTGLRSPLQRRTVLCSTLRAWLQRTRKRDPVGQPEPLQRTRPGPLGGAADRRRSP